MSSTTKSYDSGYDYFVSGGREVSMNPFTSGSTAHSQWVLGYEEAEREHKDMNEENWMFGDNCEH